MNNDTTTAQKKQFRSVVWIPFLISGCVQMLLLAGCVSNHGNKAPTASTESVTPERMTDRQLLIDADQAAKGAQQSMRQAERFLVPKGAIIMWSGPIASIPTGWALCDGSNGTPNLKDRFIVAMGNEHPLGQTGGSSAHSHTAGALKSQAHAHTIHRFQEASMDNPDKDGFICLTKAGHHGETFPRDFSTEAGGALPILGESAPASNVPPFYALAFIMKL